MPRYFLGLAHEQFPPEELGATTVVLMNVSGADPRGAIRFYGEHVLPQLR
jgi:hypothetical protein